MLTQLTIFIYTIVFLYGIVIGSFLNVCIFRIPKKENIVQSFTFSSVLYFLMTSALIVITVIDERTFQIPVTFNLFIGLLGIIMTIYDYRHIVSHLIGAVCVSLFLYGLYYFSSGKAIGGGDIKLMAYAGLLLGAKNILLAFVLACILGSVIHSIRMKVSKKNNLLAMGPYLSAGIFIAALWGDRFWTWYLGMMGIY